MNESRIKSPWVLFGIDEVVYAISSEAVLSINQISQTTPLPKTPPEVRGVIDFRGAIIQLIDLRILLNRKSIVQEIESFSQMIDQRFNDHFNWIETLKKSILENSEFTLTTDPHECEFGKWYDSYNLKNANIMFETTFRKFDGPHKEIHRIGITARELLNKGKQEEAIQLIEKTKDTELKQMLQLFDDIKIAYKESLRETILV
ncbi:MAG: CZB domain-containing protein, partial [Candidatus Gastranaerophilales bacterium]|nr:CZB domain-containing protein [Candidatus Gastranaerophilales bacterium]